jgi:methionyl-tRNA formyltransferase
VKVVIASSSGLAIPTLQALQRAKHDVIGAITNPDAPAGRGMKLKENDFARYISHTEIPLKKPSSNQELNAGLTAMQPDLVVVIAYGHLIKNDELSIPVHGWINLHFSLLPKFRGAAPVQRAIIAGESKTGVTIFKLDTGMDTGPIYLQREVAIGENENSGELLNRLSLIGAESIVDSLEKMERGEKPLPQNEDGVSYAPKIDKSELRIDWREPTKNIHQKIRAFSPTPGAWTTINGQRIVITAAELSRLPDMRPGEVASHDGLIVGTGSTPIKILKLTPAGKREMNPEDWLRGARLTPSDCFS